MEKIILNGKDIQKMVESIIKESDTFTSTFTDDDNTKQPQQQTSQPADVNNLAKVQSKATNVNKASQRINTTVEFSGAFKNWFQSLGYKPDNSAVNINRVLTLVKKSMQELGYK